MRWHAVAYYRSDQGLIDVEYDFDEIEDLHDLVERGPDWNALEKIEVTYALSAKLTIEEAARR